MKFFKKIFTLVTVLFILGACNKSNPKDFAVSNPKDFQDYIVSFTSGIISTHANIDVVLTSNLGNWDNNQVLPNDLWKITPSVPGELTYLDSGVIRFTPKKPLKHNQTYYMSLDLQNYIDKQTSKNATFKFLATTMPLNITMNVQSLQSIASTSYNLNTKFFSSDLITTQELLKMISAYQGKEKLELQVTQNQNSLSKEFNVIISDIQRLNKPSSIDIAIHNNTPGSKQSFSKEIPIPKLGEFTAFDFRTIGEDNQNIQINFSDPLNKNQNLQGLITLSPHTPNLSFTTSGNTVKIYSQTPFEQDMQVTTHPGIESIEGQKTTHTQSQTVPFELQKPEVKLLQSGHILPSSTNLKLNFQATTLSAVDVKVYRIYQNNVLQFLQDNNLSTSYNLTKVASAIAQTTMQLKNAKEESLLKWNSYALDLSTIITPQPGAIYHVELSFKPEYSLYPCQTDSLKKNNEHTPKDYYQTQIDPNSYEYDYYSYTYYNWDQKDNPCDVAYYYYYDFPTTNILASDLGVIVKRANNNVFTVITTDLVTSAVVGAATIEFYDYQQQLLASSKTDSYGILNINLDKHNPYFVVAKYNNSTTYVKIDKAAALSVSNFDVDGTTLEQGIEGFIYTERGVYRPGDSIHLGFILDDLANPLPNNHPITLTLTDPFGKVTKQINQKKNSTDHYVFTLQTLAEAPTGNWQALVNVGGVKFSKNIKVETIKPNRLKIDNQQEDHFFLANTQSPITFQVNWLQGSAASLLQANVDIKYLYESTEFKNFKNYNFNNSLEKPANTQINLFKGKTDSQGQFTFQYDTKQAPSNAGMLKAILTTKVFENAGDMSIDVSSITVSPFSSYVGIKSPEPNKYGYYSTDNDIDFQFALVNQNGQGQSGEIQLYLYRKNSYWWWSQNDIGISSYSNSSNHTLIETQVLNTNAKGLTSYKLNIPEQDWGSYELVAIDSKSGHISSTNFYVDYPYWSDKNLPNQNKQATSLTISTDKTQYTTGETIKISFPSSQGARALISVENGIGVIQTFWVITTDNETTFELPATAKMAPNAYLNVTLIQPHASTMNNAPIRLYGIAPISVYDQKTKLEPQIKMPDELKPQQEFSLEVKEKNNQKMTYTLAIVEQGLLDLTNYKTPNPWDKFYSKAALGVLSWDIFDQVIGAYGGTVNQIFSIGGDEDLAVGQVKKANRFQPVVKFLGPFTLEAGKTAKHAIELPKYIGQVKAMVVASNTADRAYGSVEKTVAVKSPLMLLGTLPRRAVTGETITLPVSVFTQDPSIKHIEVEVKTNEYFDIIGPNKKTILNNNTGEQVVYFELKAKEKLGIAKVQIQAKTQNHQASYDIELDVLNPNPLSVVNSQVVLAPREKRELQWQEFGISQSNKTNLTLSTFTGINLSSRLNYLIQYPHGCSEQITSGAMAQLYLSSLLSLNPSQIKSTQTNIKSAITQLGQRQTTSGGFLYWPSSSTIDNWSTSYIGQFFLEAEKKGYVLPIGSKAKWIEYQKLKSRQWVFDPKLGNDFNQAYRLYTLALALEPDLGAMNRLRETPNISDNSRLRLAAAYSLISQNQVAKELINQVTYTPDNTSESYTYGSPIRDMAMALDAYVLIEPNSLQTANLAKEIASSLGSNSWMSTQTTAQSLIAISNYLQGQPSSDKIQMQYKLNGKLTKVDSLDKIVDIDLKDVEKQNTLELTNLSDGTLYVDLAQWGILEVGQELVQSNNLRIQVVYKDLSGKVIDPTNIVQSTQFTAEITLTNTSMQGVDNIALTQIIPSGWEIVNLRYTQDQNADTNKVNYTDYRDDRTQFYLNLKPKQSKVLTLNLSASYLGHYYLPGVYASAMYLEDYNARTKGQWVNVTKQP